MTPALPPQLTSSLRRAVNRIGVSPAPEPPPLPTPVDHALRRLTKAADHGLLWFGIGAVAAALGKRPRRAAIRGAVSLGGASFVANSVLKPFFRRARPDPATISPARWLGKKPWTSSFPSGHAASAAAFATGAALELPASAALLGPLAAAVGYSRVHVGVHHRSDVVVGAALGVGVAVVGQKLWPAKPFAPAEMAPGQAPALPQGEGLVVVVNSKSGSADGAEDEIRAVLPRARFVDWDPDTDLDAAVGDGMRALGVAGGDGTVATVAALALRRGLPLAVFPAGTLNHFAGAIAQHTHADTAAVVESGSAGRISVAALNGELFLNTAGIGSYPEMVELRDKLSHRMGKWPAAGYALLRVMRHYQPLDLEINGRREKVWAVFVGNGVYTPRGFAPSWRDHLADGLIDLQYVRADGRFRRTTAVIASMLGLIERTRAYASVQDTKFEIRSLSGAVPTAHDGEITEPVSTVVLEVLPDLLTVYKP